METEGRLRLADVFVLIDDPRQAAKVEHDLVELLVVAVNAVLVGADTFVEIELWAREKLDWLRSYLRLMHGIPSHDTFGRIFGLIDAEQFEAAFRRWVSSVLPALGAEIVAIDGKTSRRSGGVDATALHLVSAFAAGAGLVLGQRATAAKSNEITAIPELLSTLALAGCTVTIDAMGTQTAIAEAIQNREADYVLAVKDNQPRLAESIEDFWRSFRAHPAVHTPHSFAETVDKDHGRLETRRCYAFDQLECLDKPRQDRRQDHLRTTPLHQQSGSRRTTYRSRHPLPLGGREPSALVDGCVVQRRPDARPHQGGRAQPDRAQTHHPQSHPARSGKTKRRHQSPETYRRHFRFLPSRTSRTQIMFMRLPCGWGTEVYSKSENALIFWT
jgi:predicted transposase YbfD/YdcC